MLSFFSKVLFILIFFYYFNVVISYNAEAKPKVRLSKRYIPQGNPGGASFYEDEDFAESYRLYEKRRELLKKKKLQSRADPNIDREDLVRKLRERKIALINKLGEIKACIVEDDDDAMVNQHGINITRLKGAVFIDQAQYEKSNQLKIKQNEKEKDTLTLEKKISSKKNISSIRNGDKKNAQSKKDAHMVPNADLNDEVRHNSLNSLGSSKNTANAIK